LIGEREVPPAEPEDLAAAQAGRDDGEEDDRACSANARSSPSPASASSSKARETLLISAGDKMRQRSQDLGETAARPIVKRPSPA
jgi:hypothetical protein